MFRHLVSRNCMRRANIKGWKNVLKETNFPRGFLYMGDTFTWNIGAASLQNTSILLTQSITLTFLRYLLGERNPMV